jgi:hypothetical protein
MDTVKLPKKIRQLIYFLSLLFLLDPGSGMEQIRVRDPVKSSPDPQHCVKLPLFWPGKLIDWFALKLS